MEKTKVSKKENVVFCILCEAKMKTVKISAEAKKLAKESNKGQSASLDRAPKKKMKSTKATAGIIRELRRLAPTPSTKQLVRLKELHQLKILFVWEAETVTECHL
jgi:hypothetical protein